MKFLSCIIIQNFYYCVSILTFDFRLYTSCKSKTFQLGRLFWYNFNVDAVFVLYKLPWKVYKINPEQFNKKG